MESIIPEKENCNKIPTKIMTGSHDLNRWLEGGYETDTITLFYGPGASGKSNFVLLAACHQAKKDRKVIFIDSEGSFSVDRVKQISGGIPEYVLKNIVILKPVDFSEQKDAFLKLFTEIKSKNIGLIVVDSINTLYRLELPDARKAGKARLYQVNSDMARQMRALSEIARKREIPVLITSQVHSEYLSDEDWMAGKEAGVDVVGGEMLKSFCKCIIELKNWNGRRRAIIRKHRSIPEKTLNFEIINEGIRKKGWILG
jgi:DNA repair protein RadB